ISSTSRKSVSFPSSSLVHTKISDSCWSGRMFCTNTASSDEPAGTGAAVQNGIAASKTATLAFMGKPQVKGGVEATSRGAPPGSSVRAAAPSRSRIGALKSPSLMPSLRRATTLSAAAFLAAAALPAQQPATADTAAPRDSLTRLLDAFTYRNLGPAAYSGRVTALAVAGPPSVAPKTIYVGAAGGGIWKTSNGGITWQAISEGLGVQTIGDLAVAPSDTNVVWAGTGERNSLRSQ